MAKYVSPLRFVVLLSVAIFQQGWCAAQDGGDSVFSIVGQSVSINGGPPVVVLRIRTELPIGGSQIKSLRIFEFGKVKVIGATAVEELYCASKGIVLKFDPLSNSLTTESEAERRRSILTEMEERRRERERPKREAERSVGTARDGDAEIRYPYAYQGLLVQGTSTFVFTVGPEKLSEDRTKALVRLQRIARYWNNLPQEGNIEFMPFTDPRGYKVYQAPPEWGATARVGDAAWINVQDLRMHQGQGGRTAETGKAERVAVGVVAGIAAAEAAGKIMENRSTSRREHYGDR